VSDDERVKVVVGSGEKKADGCLEHVVRRNEDEREGASEQLKRFCDARTSASRQLLTYRCE
jgi:hypothetical protein